MGLRGLGGRLWLRYMHRMSLGDRVICRVGDRLPNVGNESAWYTGSQGLLYEYRDRNKLLVFKVGGTDPVPTS